MDYHLIDPPVGPYSTPEDIEAWLADRNIEAERLAAEIRIRAERRWGQTYRQQEKNPGGGDRRSNHRLNGTTGDQQTLDQLGITKDQSSTWQKLANVAVGADV